MSDDSKYPEWFLWFSEHGVRILILVVIGGLALLYARSRTNTQERLEAIEETVQYEPPRSYTAPNLDEYAANDVSAADRGMEADHNAVTMLDRSGGALEVPLATKGEIAESILDRVFGQGDPA